MCRICIEAARATGYGSEHLGLAGVDTQPPLLPQAAIVSDFTALLSNSTWTGSTAVRQGAFVTYSFESFPASYLSGFYQASSLATFASLNEAEKQITRDALAQWGAISGLVFLETPSGAGQIRFGTYEFSAIPGSEGAAGFAYYPSASVSGFFANMNPIGGDVFIDKGQVGTQLMLHEIGHAIGLKHPFEGVDTLSSTLDNKTNTVMSYTGPWTTTLGYLDVQAAGYLYGTVDAGHLANWGWDPALLRLYQTGTTGANWIVGVTVQDYVFADNGNDTIATFDGFDTIFAGLGDDRVMAGADGDLIYGEGGNDFIYGEGGADYVDGGDGNDTIWGEEANDIISGGTGLDSLTGGIGDDYIDAGDGADIVWGEDGNDTLFGGTGADQLSGGAGNDTYYIDSTTDFVTFENSGYDTIFSTVNFSLGSLAIEELRAASWVVTGLSLTGSGGNNVLVGGGGNDTLASAGGIDTIYGGAGSDTANFQGAQSSYGLVRESGGQVYLRSAGGISVTYDVELLKFGVSPAISVGSLALGGGGTAGNDFINGASASDQLDGAVGNDTVNGGGGNDTVAGGSGDDVLAGGAGADFIVGGIGSDWFGANVDQSNGGTGVTVYLQFNIVLDGFGSTDTIMDVENVVGSNALFAGQSYWSDIMFGNGVANVLFAQGGNDYLDGGDGADSIYGGTGNDAIIGGAGNELIYGEAGIDYIYGGQGSDYIAGGADSDIFFFEAGLAGGVFDTIADFQPGLDYIGLSSSYASSVTVSTYAGVTYLSAGGWSTAINGGTAAQVEAAIFYF
jgi:Ca2+-binding RTX toxin-like protein